MACDAKTLMVAAAANGYYGLQDRELRMAILYMLCSGGGGGGGGGSGGGGGVSAPFNVKTYGAVGNNIADDTTSIKAAVAAAVAAGGGTVYFPAGTYLITSEIAWNTSSLRFIGDGYVFSIIKQTTNAANILHCTDANGLNYCVVQDLHLLGTGLTTSTGSGILIDDSFGAADNWVISRCWFEKLGVGMRVSSFDNSLVEACNFDNCKKGFWADSNSNSNVLLENDFTTDQGSRGTGIVGVRLDVGRAWSIIGGDMGAVTMDIGLEIGNHGSAAFAYWSGSNCENNIAGAIPDGFVTVGANGNLTMEHIYVSDSGAVTAYPITVANGGLVAINNCSLQYNGTNGGVIKAFDTINCTVIDMLNGRGGYLVDYFSAGVFNNQMVANGFFTITQSDGSSPSATTRGKIRMQAAGASNGDDAVFIDIMTGAAAAHRANILQYDADVRSNIAAKRTSDNAFTVSQSFAFGGVAASGNGYGTGWQVTPQVPASGRKIEFGSGQFTLREAFIAYASADNAAVTIPGYYLDCANNRTTIGHNANTQPAGTYSLNVENGDIAALTVGGGFRVKEGSNAKMGTATLNGVTEVTVSTTAVTANSRILMTINTPGGTPGSAYVSSRVGGTSFGIKSTGAADSSTVAWMIVEPA